MLPAVLLTSSAIGAPDVPVPGVMIFEAESYDANTPRSAHLWQLTTTVPGFSGTGYMQALPDDGSNLNTTWTNSSPELQYSATLDQPGTYYVWIRAYPTSGDDDSLHAGIDGSTSGASRIFFSTYNTWSWTNRVQTGEPAYVSTTSTGVHTFSLWMREDGARIDRMVLTTNPLFRARAANAWHTPSSVDANVGLMRTPATIHSNSTVSIFSGSQYQGGGEAGNQIAGATLFYKHATGSVWSSSTMSWHTNAGNNAYYKADIAANLYAVGSVVQYYIKLPFSDFLTTYVCSAGGITSASEDEQYARSNPFTYTVLDPSQTNAPASTKFASPDDWRDQNIYFIFTDRFNDGNPGNNNSNPQSTYQPANSRRIHGGDFKGIQDKLNYIRALGATAIWITPIPQNVGDSAYHGYGADNFRQVQPNWGSMADLSNMVAEAHRNGIYVILDIVCNHTGNRIDSTDSGWSGYKSSGYNLRWTTGVQYPAPFNSLSYFHNNGHIGTFSDPEQVLGELSGLDDLRTEDTYVRTNMVAIYREWIAAADFDGFRIDTVKHVDIGFWQVFNSQIRAYAASIGKTNFFQFGEVFDGSDGKCGYYTGTKAGGAFANDAVIDYPLYFKVNSVFATASGSTVQLEDRYNAIAANYDPYAADRLVTFLDNHDQPRFMSTGNANNNTNRLAVALSFLYSSRGVPCLYYGTEQNFNGSGDPNNREDMFAGQFEQGPSVGDNFDMTKGTFLHVAKMNNLRRLYPSLRRGTHVNIWNNPSGPGLFAFARRLGSEESFVVFNTASGSQTLPNRPTSYAAGTVLVNVLNTNEKVTVVAGVDGFPSISVPATSAKIFVAEPSVLPLDPVVIRQSIAHAAANVSATSPITLTFSKSMNTGAVQAAFTTTPAAGGSFSWNVAKDAMTFTPSPGFVGSTTIVVRVGTNAFDGINSNHMFASYESYFRTAAASFTDSVPPQILVQAPTPGAIVTGFVAIAGTASDNATVVRVEAQFDGGDWFTVTGTTTWAYTFDSANFLNGEHLVSTRSVDSSGNFSSVSNVNLRFFNVPGNYVRRINAGGIVATNCDLTVWSADRAYTPGGFGYVDGTNGFLGNSIIGICSSAQLMYQRERYSTPAGTFRYLFDCPEGVYETRILETETWVTNSGMRIFDLYIQDQRMLTNFDIYAASGGMNRPLSLAFTNDVIDAQLELHFIPFVDNARVSAVEVRRIADVDTDFDGIPNWWMRGWFNHPTGQDADQSNAWDDPDQDGVNNRDEFIAMTSPIDTASFPIILNITSTTGSSVAIPTVSGRLYHLDWKKDLLSTDTWITLEGNIPGNNNVMELMDTNSAESGVYRVRISTP